MASTAWEVAELVLDQLESLPAMGHTRVDLSKETPWLCFLSLASLGAMLQKRYAWKYLQ